jgi:ABC-type transport system involved in multi-copper enzyme maturation permease subunit
MTAYVETAPAVAFTRPSLPRLSAVELRKMADTRAGFWLLLVVGLVAAGIVTITAIWGGSQDQNFAEMFRGALWVVSVLLPVLGILAVTSEWSQRTALTTFSLVPGRQRVIVAKMVAGIGLALAAVALCLLTAAIGNLFVGGSWSLELSQLVNGALFEVLGMLGGIAFGLAFLSSPLAIVLYFVLPTVWAILGESIHALNKPAEWLDTSSSMQPLVDNTMAGGDWARLATSVALWVGVALVIGLLRLRRSELK